MPSWNIHTAHVERLLAEEDASSLGIRDVNAFLMGNIIPDVYVGYMVPNPTRKIDYRVTHLADPSHVPEPRYGEFFERFAVPSADASGRVSDVVLGAWTHLVADNLYNLHFNRLIKRIGVKPSSTTRARKQSDFDIFGRTLDIHMVPEPTSELIEQCAAFPQYAIEESDVRAACKVMRRIVADNAANHVSDPVYDLLGSSYFTEIPTLVDARMREALHAYAAGDPAWGVQR